MLRFICDLVFVVCNLQTKGLSMCLAITGKIKKIKGDKAFFDYEGKECSSDISFAPEVEIGDWILMHDGRALSKISQKEAEENLEFIKTHEKMHNYEH